MNINLLPQNLAPYELIRKSGNDLERIREMLITISMCPDIILSQIETLSHVIPGLKY